MTMKRKLAFDGDVDLSQKAQRYGLPDRWKFCPPMGKVVVEKFLPMKTPLDYAYDSLMERQYQFHPEDVFKCQAKSRGPKIGMWIDLTNTSRFYNKSEVEKNGCIYKKIKMTGHGEAPTAEQTSNFLQMVNEFYKSHSGQLIAIHCTHGFNRTGFLIVAYLVTVFDMAVDMAVAEFAGCRPNGIYKPDYLNELRRRYGDEDDVLEAFGRPAWETQPLSDDDYYFGMRNDIVASMADMNDIMNVPSTSNGFSNGAATNGSTTNGNSRSKKPQFMEGRVPSVTFVDDAQTVAYLHEKVRNYCHFNKNVFPGSQPVSLELNKNLDMLARAPYMVSWKADGMRYLVLIEGRGQVYAFDRDNNTFLIRDVTFLNRKTGQHLKNTLVDAEMIIETVNGVDIPRLLIYDVVAFEDYDIGKKDYTQRFEAIAIEIILPRQAAMSRREIKRETEPISIRRKDFWMLEFAYKLYESKFMDSIGHEVDGLIFQPIKLPYTAGRCDELLKWKPPGLNTVDFRLEIKKEQPPGELPYYVAHLYVQHYDRVFAKMKATNFLKQYDGKIVECSFNPKLNSWEFMRERTDKSHPNAYTTAISVCNTITHPVTQEYLMRFIAEQRYHE